MSTHEILTACSDPYSAGAFDIPQEARSAFMLAMGAYIEDGVHGLWYEPSDRHDGHTPDSLASTIGMRFAQLANLYNSGGMQSPIEHMLAGALLWVDVDWGGMPRVDPGAGPQDWRQEWKSDHLEFVITPQAEIAGYRVDFLLWFAKGRHVEGIAVECDGHAFHEKTKEQAARDKKRDRSILAAGFPMLRFSGSEIFRDVLGCVGQIHNALTTPLHRVSKDSGLF